MPIVCQSLSRDTVHLFHHTLEYSHGSWVVVDSPGSPQSSGDNGWGGHEIVCEGVVEVTLELEDVLDRFEFLLVSAQNCLLERDFSRAQWCSSACDRRV